MEVSNSDIPLINLGGSYILIQNSQSVISSLTLRGGTITVQNCPVDTAKIYSYGTSSKVDNTVLLSNNKVIGPLTVDSSTISQKTIKQNSFQESASLIVKGPSLNINLLVEFNDFLRGLSQVESDSLGSTWSNNYWANTDPTRPLPLLGKAKSADYTPSAQPNNPVQK